MSTSADQTRFDFDDIDTVSRYKLLSFTIVPRPIAWVSTVDQQGHRNLAPFSFFNVVATDPPLIALGITTRAGGKDTPRHIRETGQFVVNLVPRRLIGAMNVSAIEFPPEVDEIAAAGLETIPSERVVPPRVAGAPVAYECETFQLIDLPSGQCVVIGRVLCAHIDSIAVRDASRCHIDTAALELVGRMDNRYVHAGEIFDLPRISVQEWRDRSSEATSGSPLERGRA